MSMEEKNNDTKTLQVAKDHIVPLIEQFSLVQNELSGLFSIPQASGPSVKAADAWWQVQKEEAQHTYRGALAAIAAPMLIADVGINARNQKLIITHAVVPSLRWNDPIYLLAQDNDKTRFRLEYLKQTDLFTNTLLLYLQGAAPVYEMEMKFEVSVRDFAVLLATADLLQRLQYRALLDYAAAPLSVKADDVMVSVTEGFVYPDPRWLLPFSLPALHLSPAAMSRESTRQSLENLVKTGLLKKDGDMITLMEPGERFCESVAGRTSCIRIDTRGVDEKGKLGRQSVLFIRGEHFLWYAGTSGKKADTMVVASTGLDQAETLLKELFTPLAAPKPGEPARPALVVAPVPLQAPASDAAPQVHARPPPPPQAAVPVAAPAAGRMVCKACGNPLTPGERFCSKCLVKVPEILAPAVALAAVEEHVPAPAVAPTTSATGLVCKACGNPLKPGDKFCSKCLVKVPETPATAAAPAHQSPPPQPADPARSVPAAGNLICKACGNPVKPGLKFCSNCGKKIG